MARLPQPGGDNGNWGDILNEYLNQTLKADGSLKDNSVTANTLAPNSITNAAIATDAVNAASIADGSITNAQLANATVEEGKLSSAVQTKLNANGGTPDWGTIANKPAVIAAGADQASARTAIGAGTSNLIIGTTSSTAKAGNYQPQAADISDATTVGRSILLAANVAAVKALLSVSKSDVGLENVDNTSDATKNDAAVTLTNKTLVNPRINALWDSNERPTIELVGITDATNHYYVTNQSAGNYPTIGTSGSDANIGIALAPKGSGAVRLYSTSGNSPTIDVAGPDTNLGLNIVTKGSGQFTVNGSPIASDANVVHKSGEETISGDKIFTGVNEFRQMNYFREVVIEPNGGAGNTAAFQLDNKNGQSWLNSNNSSGTFAIYDNTHSKTPFAIQPDSPNNALLINDGANNMSQILDMHGNDIYLNYGRITEGAINTVSPESNGFVILPHLFNDIAFNGQRGGSVIVRRNGTVVQSGSDALQESFRPDTTFPSLSYSNVSDVFTIEVTLYKTFYYGMRVGIAQTDWIRARDVKIEQYNVASSSWSTVIENTNGAHGLDYIGSDAGSGGVSKLRYTLGNFTQSAPDSIRITNMFLISFDSGLGSSSFLPRGGGALYGDLDLQGTLNANNKRIKGVGGIEDANGSILIDTYADANVSNWLDLGNAGTGYGPFLRANGSDANVDLNLNSKGTGKVRLNGAEIPTVSSTDTLTNKTLTTPVINGIPTGTGVSVTANANTIALRNAQSNIVADAFVPGSTSTPTTNGTTILTVDSTEVQIFTGTLSHTLTMPTTNIKAGQRYTVINGTTNGGIQINTSGGNSLLFLNATWVSTLTAKVDSPTAFLDWAVTSMPGTGNWQSGSPSAYTILQRTAEANALANNFISSVASTVTSNITTTLTIASAQTQIFTGTTAQIVLMPTASITIGQTYTIVNQSTVTITISSSAGNLITNLSTGKTAVLTAVITTPTAATHWSAAVTNSGTVMNFPTTSATIARADAAQTFTGIQTFSSAPSFSTLPTGAGVASAATASTLVSRDVNANVSARGFLQGFTTTAANGGTVALLVTSNSTQVYTGTSTQIVTLPTTSIVAGAQYTIINQSTGAVTVQSSGLNTVATLNSGVSVVVTALVASPTTAAHWYAQVIGAVASSQPRVTSVTSSATPTYNVDATDLLTITAQAVAITSMSSGMTGTPANGQKFMVRIKDNGSPQSIVWGANFVSSGNATLLSATVAGKSHNVGFNYDSVAAKWVCIAVDATGY